jgi:hypothetical protein
MKPTSNYVIVKPIQDTSVVGSLYIDTSWKPENHVQVINEVVAVPDKLKRLPIDSNGFMEWETPMELEVGDQVWVNYLAILKALEVDIEGEKCKLVPYSKIYFALRGEAVIALNGYVLVEPIPEPEIKTSLILKSEPKEKKTEGIVRYFGMPNTRYFDPTTGDSVEAEEVEISEGDHIVLKRGYYSKIENELHQSFGNYLIVHRRNIVGKFTGEV